MSRWEDDPTDPLGDLYAHVLDLLHLELNRLAGGHDEHLLGDGPDWCSRDRDLEGGTVCDDLGGQLLDAVDAAFVVEHLDCWVTFGPEALLEWHSDLGGHTAVEVILNALRYDAEQRLLDPANGWPVR